MGAGAVFLFGYTQSIFKCKVGTTYNKEVEMTQTKKRRGIKLPYEENKIKLYAIKSKALEYVDDYELTKEFSFEKEADGKVKKTQKPFSIVDGGTEYVSLLPASALIQLIKQLVVKLGL